MNSPESNPAPADDRLPRDEPAPEGPRTRTPRLHIFLGAGGVGKTTLSAALAVHLAFQGRRVGLLSIDPAKRLKTALGADHIDESGRIFWPAETLRSATSGETTQPGSASSGELRAAVLSLPDSLRRWIRDEGLGGDHERLLFDHPLFQVLAEKIASATETLAPIRMAEWLEQFPETDDLIIDTAPGLHAVDFLIRPERLLAFFDSKILDWLKWFAGGESADSGWVQKIFRAGAKSILQALGRAGGENILLSLAELLLLMDRVMFRMVDRLEEARRWIRNPATRVVLVCAPRDDAISTASELSRNLAAAGLPEPKIVLNRSIPASFLNEVTPLLEQPEAPFSDGFDGLFLQYLRSAGQIRTSIMDRLKGQAVHEIPVYSGLEESGELRLDELDRLGAWLN